ncbi:hypothetical protein [Bradyrhizobium sp. CSS354]|uniref:hypothetical protein n=1 Tax=Bradyrhizobium sp. CSS354 TaxID=2699172 RepID=UPI0023B0800E|nr:hypothetical protein [Bradyrhizobium sp. CSS354]MDE5460194.1 hypothetical protein [Bradyrhizobium sp. CSS354]
MAEVAVAETYSIEDAANALVETPTSAPAVYDPGQIESDTPAEYRSRGGLTEAEAVDLLEDDSPVAAGRALAYHNGKPLKLQHLIQGFNEGLKLYEVVDDINSRYDAVEQAGRNVYIGANAIAELLATLFPHPNAAMATTDPIGYQQAQVVHEQVNNAAIQVTRYAQGLAQQNAEWAKAQSSKDSATFGLACFLEDYPQAKDPEWLNQFVTRITPAAEACGYHASELMQVTDSRAFKVLELAATALEKRQGGSAKRESVKPPAKPRLVSGQGRGGLTMSEAMGLDFD